MALIKGNTYHNVFYDNVLIKLRSIITTDRPCTVYISPRFKDYGSYSIRLWGFSSETDELFATEWRKVYNTTISLYSIGDESERFYEQFYSDAERLYQLLFNNMQNGANSFPWVDGTVGEVVFDDFEDDEETIDNLHVARFDFSCRISRA